ncbi:MAG: hypothetical protein LQ350_002668 [Teloschistes chrysophthalmus]|nr:MAG: hypothetical protein LQ350_002668 [Niorma chrysophthalma]
MPSHHLDAIIENHLWDLEYTALRYNSRFPINHTCDGRKPSLAAAARAFYGLKETSSTAKGRGFSDRAKQLLEKMAGKYPRVDFAGVKDFWMRQEKVVLEGKLAESRERLNMLDLEGEEGTKEEGDAEMQDGVVDRTSCRLTDEKTQRTIPTIRLLANSPAESRPSVSFRVRSINTATRFLVAKEHSPPFALVFNSVTRTYGLQESGCDISDPTTRLLHHLNSYNLGCVAYCSGSPNVHTRSVDYLVKRKATLDRGAEVEGGFVNLGCEDEEEAKDLVMHFEERKMEGVKVDRVSL